jgi:acetyl-CoA acyltransferase
MKPHRRVFLAGHSVSTFLGKNHPDFIWKKHPDFGVRENPTLEDYLVQAAQGAMDAAGVTPDQVEKGYVGNFAGELFSSQGHLGAMLSRGIPELEGVPFSRIEGACASGGLAIVSAMEALQAGHDVVLAVGAETQTTVSAREGADYLARASHYATERGLDDFTFPAMFARRGMHWKEATGATDEDIALVVAKAYAQGNLNPKAHMQAVKMPLEVAAVASDRNPVFLGNEALRPHLKISDCSQVSDGGAAVVLVSEAGLQALGQRPEDAVEVVAWSQSTAPLGQVRDYTRLDNTARAAGRLWADAGIGAGDVGVWEVHDCFAVTELLMMEAVGLATFGQSPALVREGRTAMGGDMPINTGGGLLAFGHPVGATGVKQLIEVARQMRREAGAYQIARAARWGVTVNMGGDDRTTVCLAVRHNGV